MFRTSKTDFLAAIFYFGTLFLTICWIIYKQFKYLKNSFTYDKIIIDVREMKYEWNKSFPNDNYVEFCVKYLFQLGRDNRDARSDAIYRNIVAKLYLLSICYKVLWLYDRFSSIVVYQLSLALTITQSIVNCDEFC